MELNSPATEEECVEISRFWVLILEPEIQLTVGPNCSILIGL